MAVLRLDGIRFSYEERPVLHDVSIDVRAKELVVILGASGSGKSTILRLVAGLETPKAGTIWLNGQTASADGRILLEPAARHLSLVFQDLALWPHLTCDEQLHFMAPALEGPDRQALLKDVGLAGFGGRPPAHMSGGERQRLALARALAARPDVLLLDEPFANLDPRLRFDLRRLLLDLRQAHPVTIVYVTHDLEDAFALADRVAVLNRGTIEQVGNPETLYRHPASAFVATFVGRAALVPATVDGNELRTSLGNVPNPRTDLRAGDEIDVVLRPEDVSPAEEGEPARVDEVLFAGDRYLVRAFTRFGAVWFHVGSPPARGETIGVRALRGWPVAR
ncbi:MAG TPA: ABC transporter ATP-binding protein [Vicinamibacteria bacterium]|nr:ABC transporter ATP-binding protein [Vicinamibacteria bacterium]